jgi:TatD DNase family protein
MLIDSHAHLYWNDFDADRDEVIRRAGEAGIRYIVNIGTDLSTTQQAISLAEKYDWMFATAGIHPHDAKEAGGDSLVQLEELARHPKVMALGEIGLDYFRNLSPRDVQQDIFRKQIRIAHRVQKPVVIHDRDAHEDILQILKEEQGSLVGGVMHCFSGDMEFAKKCLDLGFYISFAGNITYKKSVLTEPVKYVPLDRIFLETDCPFLSPEPFRGKRNEPARVSLVAEKVAGLKGVEKSKVEEQTSENVIKLFKLK